MCACAAQAVLGVGFAIHVLRQMIARETQGTDLPTSASRGSGEEEEDSEFFTWVMAHFFSLLMLILMSSSNVIVLGVILTYVAAQ